MIELLTNLSTYLSVPLLLIFGWIVFELWKRIEKLKNEQINLGNKINALKDEEIKILERHLNEVKDTQPDPERILASVEIIEKASKQQIENLKREKEEALKKYTSEKQQREYIEKLYSNANSITDSDNTILEIISHEATNPLVSIRASANRVKLKATHFADNPSMLSTYMDDIENAAYGLIVLFTGIPNILRQSARLNLEETSIYEDILSRLISMVKVYISKTFDRSVDISYESSENIGIVYVDRRLTEQAFYNLLMNAMQYHDPNNPNAFVNIIVKQADDHIEVKFRDNGIGIEADEVNRIFMQGYRSRQALQHFIKGTGLGLTVARKAAELHGGTLELTSNSNPTEFTYSIPIKNMERGKLKRVTT